MSCGIVFAKYCHQTSQMEGDVTKLSTRELEEWIRELENTYAEFFGAGGDVGELHHIRRNIMELQKELSRRRSN